MQVYWRFHTRQIQAVKRCLDVLSQALKNTFAVIRASQFMQNVFIEAGVPPEQIIFSRLERFPGLAAESMQKVSSPVLRGGY